MMKKLKETLESVVVSPKFGELACLEMEKAAMPCSRAWGDEPDSCAAVPWQLW